MRNRPKLIYVSNARLPTEKAHGYQIVKMSEAFARRGLEVELWHPFRRHRNPALNSAQINEYYGIPSVFRLRTLPNVDVTVLARWLPQPIFAPISALHSFIWAFLAGRYARRASGDLYYARDPSIGFWLVRFGLSTILEVHVIPRRLGRWLLRRIGNAASLELMVALTTHTKDRLVALGVPAERILVSPDAVDLENYRGLPQREECRRMVGLPEQRPIVGYVGRFQAMEMEKGIPELIAAIAQMQSIGEERPLLVCVGGPMEAVPTYLKLARKLHVSEDSLRFVDRVPNRDVPLWIASCDVVTIPWRMTEFSAFFTSPLKLFEYMAAGVPIVASSLPSLRDVLADGENALLVEPGDPNALAKGLKRVLDDPQLGWKLARAALAEVEAYTWDRRAEGILMLAGVDSR